MMSKRIELETRILEIAYALFLKKGYTNTTMDRIAQELAISKKTLYKYYTSKLELLGGTFEQLKFRLNAKVEELVENKYLPFSEKFKSMLTAIASDLAPINPELLADLKDHAPEIWKALQEFIRESTFMRFQKLIQEGIEKGYIAAHTNKNLVVFMYASSIQNLVDHTFLSQFPREMKENLKMSSSEIFEQAINIIYQGIMTEDARKEFRLA